MNTIKRLLAPAARTPKVRWIGVLAMLNWSAFGIATVFVTKYVGDQIQEQQFDMLPIVLIGYCIFFILSFWIKYLTRIEAIARGRYIRTSAIWKEFYENFFSSDISAIEKIGTGRVVEIVSTGVKQRRGALNEIQHACAKTLANIGVVIVILIELGWRYIPVFFVVLCIVLYLVNHFYKKMVVAFETC